MPVFSLRASTLAFGTTDPVESFTVPVIVERSDWAKALAHAMNTSAGSQALGLRTKFMRFSSESLSWG
jgi:hypothetical protein